MYNFCSITSVNYVYQTLALTTCLKKEKFNILCLDKDSLDFFLSKNLKKVKVFSLDDLTYQKNLNDIRINRSYLEFIFTLKPIFLYFIFKNLTQNSKIIYLDSDIFFFQDIKYLKNNLKNYSIFLTEHNFSLNNIDKKKYGLYNAGFIAFNKDLCATEALKWWKKSCIKKCSFKMTRNHFADQKYLDQFSKKFKKVLVINKNIFNIAPWNVDNLINSNNDYKNIRINFFHFQGLKSITNNIFQLGLSDYHVSKKGKSYLDKFYYFYCLRMQNIIKKNKIPRNINFFIRFKFFIKAFFRNDLFFIK
jgi:lipopolysaccharide biosynthesis glycosyltransferase